MRYEPNLWGYVTCPQCSTRFLSDCGVDFCSSSCESEYDRDHAECECCGKETGEDYLNKNGVCEKCEEMEEMETEIEVVLPSAM